MNATLTKRVPVKHEVCDLFESGSHQIRRRYSFKLLLHLFNPLLSLSNDSYMFAYNFLLSFEYACYSFYMQLLMILGLIAC
uniref:Putative ovule protein n=1 Tax=Solanum chacoense TaxID=4108 RepID=A0A0V0IX59_SOLCH